MEIKHTPTPWIALKSTASFYEIIQKDDVHSIAYVWDGEGRDAKATAAFIVRACNAHDELTKALTECVEALNAELGLDERYRIEAIQEDALERAEALLKRLAKAEGR